MAGYRIYEYVKDGKVVHKLHAKSLVEADAILNQKGYSPAAFGLHIRQDPKELAKEPWPPALFKFINRLKLRHIAEEEVQV